MEIRKISDKERHALMELYRYAYTKWSDQDIKDEQLEEIIAEETLGLFEKGRLLSSLRVHDFQQSVRGVLKECGGIAGVATYPEARRQGYIRNLMQDAFKLMHSQGQSVSMLDPFKPSFYAQFGFVSANAPYLVEAPLKQLRPAKIEKKEKNWTYEHVRAVDAKERFLSFVREVGPTQHHGYVVYKSIPDGMWKLLMKDSLVVFIKHNGKIQAASRYYIKGERVNRRWHATMTVIEMLWRTREARERLLDFFSKHYDQIHDIVIHAPFDISVEHWFEDARLTIERKNPWMVRVIDVIKATENLPSIGEETITIEITDADCPWNNGVFSMQSHKNQLRLAKSSGNPVVKATIEAFTSLVFGTLPFAEITFQGGLTFTAEWARDILQSWFHPIPLYNVLYF